MAVQQEQIAQEFERQVERSGYAKATLDDVARELRISKKTIYAHFDSKRDIYRHIVERHAQRERLRMSVLVSRLPTTREKVETLLRLVLDTGRSHIDETTEAEWLQEYEVASDAFKTAYGSLIRELFAEGVAAGEFRDGGGEFVEKMIAAMLTEYLGMVNADPDYDRDAELVERTLRFIS